MTISAPFVSAREESALSRKNLAGYRSAPVANQTRFGMASAHGVAVPPSSNIIAGFLAAIKVPFLSMGAWFAVTFPRFRRSAPPPPPLPVKRNAWQWLTQPFRRRPKVVLPPPPPPSVWSKVQSTMATRRGLITTVATVVGALLAAGPGRTEYTRVAIRRYLDGKETVLFRPWPELAKFKTLLTRQLPFLRSSSYVVSVGGGGLGGQAAGAAVAEARGVEQSAVRNYRIGGGLLGAGAGHLVHATVAPKVERHLIRNAIQSLNLGRFIRVNTP
jgi:hypothetical protein